MFGADITAQEITNTSDTANSMPSNVLSTLKILTHSIFTITLRERNYYFTNFTGEKTDSGRLNNLPQAVKLLGGKEVAQARQPGSESMLLTTVLSHSVIIKHKQKHYWLNDH